MIDKHSIIKKINDMQLETDPWVHGYIDNFFDDESFKSLCSAIDGTTSCEKPPGSAVDNQAIFDISNATEFPEVWNNYTSVFSDRDVLATVLAKFGVRGELGELRHDIHKCTTGFRLGEHNDVKPWLSNLVSLQVYCARDMSSLSDGTKLFDSNGVVKKVIEYVPNRAWLFSANKDTFHGVGPIELEYRTSLLMKFGIRK